MGKPFTSRLALGIGRRLALFMLGSALCLTACSNEKNFAPVADLNPIEAIPAVGTHTVVAGETLYAIAWRYGLDYRVLATANHIAPPYTIQRGQQIMIDAAAVRSPQSSPPSSATQPQTTASSEPPIVTSSSSAVSVWRWPAKGKVITPYSSQNKGINIAGRQGDAIFAAAGGVVVYSGDGLRGYGNLIIIKHNNVFLSAYAHCRRVLVHEGQSVLKGQKIAEMGHSGSEKTMLHFEIRQAGNPLDPLTLLP